MAGSEGNEVEKTRAETGPSGGCTYAISGPRAHVHSAQEEEIEAPRKAPMYLWSDMLYSIIDKVILSESFNNCCHMKLKLYLPLKFEYII